jgi:hypothetical protein
MSAEPTENVPELTKSAKRAGVTRMILNAASGAIPIAGGVLAAAASA